MKSKQAVLAGLILSVSLGVSAGDKKDCSKALKGIVHFSDDDVRFHSKDGVVVFVDPVNGPEDSVVAVTKMVKPDLILITHPHGDHFQPDVLKAYLKANPKAVLAGPAEVVKQAKEKGIDGMKEVAPNQHYELAGVKFETLPAYFSEGDSHPKSGNWVGYVLQLNGLRYYVTGDTEPVSEMAESKADVIFPLLYGCGGNLDSAVKMAELSKASIVVPVHTGGRVEVIEKYIAGLPKDVQCCYYLKGKLVLVQ
ncbi:MAG: MBL fold metallo-hydrolase [Syntrophaceae bacterium]|nr:MBL fold metallo-hydrolase [Syntrophaceae bacterium]